MSAICIIPARGGSTRIPRKNIRLFAHTGRTMLAMAVDLARSTGLFETIYVSTEDAEIKAVALGAGACVLNRPPAYAENGVGTQAVMRQALADVLSNSHARGKESIEIDHACCLYPCTPLLTKDDLLAGYERMLVSAPIWGKSFVFGAIRSHLKLGDCLVAYDDNHTMRRAVLEDDLKDADLWHDAGQFYFGYTAAFLAGRDLWEYALPYQLVPHRAIDINYPSDLEHAELVWEGLHAKGKCRE